MKFIYNKMVYVRLLMSWSVPKESQGSFSFIDVLTKYMCNMRCERARKYIWQNGRQREAFTILFYFFYIIHFSSWIAFIWFYIFVCIVSIFENQLKMDLAVFFLFFLNRSKLSLLFVSNFHWILFIEKRLSLCSRCSFSLMFVFSSMLLILKINLLMHTCTNKNAHLEILNIEFIFNFYINKSFI